MEGDVRVRIRAFFDGFERSVGRRATQALTIPPIGGSHSSRRAGLCTTASANVGESSVRPVPLSGDDTNVRTQRSGEAREIIGQGTDIEIEMTISGQADSMRAISSPGVDTNSRLRLSP